jgi:hypothetical protein
LDHLIMGFAVYYRSLETVDPKKPASLEAMCNQLCRGRTWLSCEPVCFFDSNDDGHMLGGSKPNFMPHPDDVASAESEGLPDGRIQDALNVLCQLSRDHGVDWEISHDYSDGPIGLIRNGHADPEVLQQIEGFGELGDILEEFGPGDAFGNSPDDENDGPNLRLFHPND